MPLASGRGRYGYTHSFKLLGMHSKAVRQALKTEYPNLKIKVNIEDKNTMYGYLLSGNQQLTDENYESLKESIEDTMLSALKVIEDTEDEKIFVHCYLGEPFKQEYVYKNAESKEIKKDSCCCGATKKNPCACMYEGVMKCSPNSPKCPCYKGISFEAQNRYETGVKINRKAKNRSLITYRDTDGILHKAKGHNWTLSIDSRNIKTQVDSFAKGLELFKRMIDMNDTNIGYEAESFDAERGCYPCPDCGTMMYENTYFGFGAHCSCSKCGSNYITKIMDAEEYLGDFNRATLGRDYWLACPNSIIEGGYDKNCDKLEVIGYDDEAKVMCSNCDESWPIGARDSFTAYKITDSFNVEFNEWADQEMQTHGDDISFKEWADDEGEKHGNSEITDWAQHEDESHDARYGAERYWDEPSDTFRETYGDSVEVREFPKSSSVYKNGKLVTQHSGNAHMSKSKTVAEDLASFSAEHSNTSKRFCPTCHKLYGRKTRGADIIIHDNGDKTYLFHCGAHKLTVYNYKAESFGAEPNSSIPAYCDKCNKEHMWDSDSIESCGEKCWDDECDGFYSNPLHNGYHINGKKGVEAIPMCYFDAKCEMCEENPVAIVAYEDAPYHEEYCSKCWNSNNMVIEGAKQHYKSYNIIPAHANEIKYMNRIAKKILNSENKSNNKWIYGALLVGLSIPVLSTLLNSGKDN